ncbi:MAG: amidohydrolase family protein [Acidobacteria bacterium]|nr:amidohydrolase family protein [Acidobacteriota bacterium]
MTRNSLLCLLALLPCFAFVNHEAASAPDYDLVITNGRVLDPESKLDAVRHLGIRGKTIAAISTKPLTGKTVIDAKGLVVAPGFIDLHSHGQTDENYRYKALDGVTTALEMEVGVSPVAAWYAERTGKAIVNFGATVGHIPARIKVTGDSGAFLPRDKAINTRLTTQEAQPLNDLIKRGLDEGALGIGQGIQYVPGAAREEILDLFQIAAERKVATFIHLRSAGAVEPASALAAVQEVIANAAATGASLHIVHITSTCLRQTATALRMIDGARRRGLDVTTEAYPYTAGMTGLETAIFSEGWQERMNIGFGDLQWAATGERLTAESFEKYRKQGGMVAIHSIPEDIVRLAVAHPGVMIASDGILENGKGHPRAAGTYARVLGRYVREQKALGLLDAIGKMTLLPAQRLEKAVPMMRAKGRIKLGADADVTVFDPMAVNDRATFEQPAQFSVGIQYVLVNGVLVVNAGKLVDGVKPGVAIRR